MPSSPLRASVRPLAAVALSAALSLPLTLISCSRGAGAGGAGGRGPGGGMPPMPVEVVTLQRQTLRDPFRALGSLEALQEAEVVAEVAGRVLEVPFAEGRGIENGAVLARLDDREARAELERAQARLALAQSGHQRVEQLFTRDLAAPRERDESRAALAVAEAEVALQQTRFDKTVVRAPFTGVAGRRYVSVGSRVAVGDPIARVARLDRLRVRFPAPERLAATIRVGASVTLGVSAYPGRTFSGRVVVVEPVVDPESRTFGVIAEVANPGGLLKPGMSADVNTALSERAGVLTVPDEAVLAEGDKTFVYAVQPDSTVQRADITLGVRDAAQVEVVSGLSPGAIVVRAGHQKIFPGARVMPVPAPAAAAGATPAAAGGSK